jgi:branched-chain amino acid transport system substrate-binding protein
MNGTAPRTGTRRRSGWTVSTCLAVGVLMTVSACGTRLSGSQIRSAGSAGTQTLADGTTVTNGGGSGTGTGGDASTSTSGAVSTTPGSAANPAGTSTTGGSAPVGGTTGGTSPTGGSTGGSSSTGGATGGSATGGSATGGSATGGAAPAGGSSSAGNAAITGPSAKIFGGSGCGAAAKGSTIPLGNVSTLSGVLGQLFAPVVPALQTFVKAQNACGGLNGHPIQLFVQDDQGDPTTARSNCQDMVQNKKVVAFLGDIQVLTIDAMKSCIDSTGIPIVGGDITNNTWFGDPLLFPQGPPPQSISYGYLEAMKNRFKSKVVGDIYCLEVPQACQQIDKAFGELAPALGLKAVVQTQVSITAPSYTSQCNDLQAKKVESVSLTFDAGSAKRFAQSCDKIGYHPHYAAYPLGVGNESLFLGEKLLANTYVPLNTFAWMASSTPAEKNYQASVAKYNPGFSTGDAAGLGWTAGALLVAGARGFTDSDASTKTLLNGLYSLKKETLGGLAAPLTFAAGKHPVVPYCLFAAISNANNDGWATPVSVPVCTTTQAPSTPH